MRDRSGDCLDFDSDLSENMDCFLPRELNWVIGNKKKRATKLMEIDTQNKVKQPTILVSCKKKHQARVSSPLPRVVPYLSVIYNLCKLFAVPSGWIAIRVIYHHLWCNNTREVHLSLTGHSKLVVIKITSLLKTLNSFWIKRRSYCILQSPVLTKFKNSLLV